MRDNWTLERSSQSVWRNDVTQVTGNKGRNLTKRTLTNWKYFAVYFAYEGRNFLLNCQLQTLKKYNYVKGCNSLFSVLLHDTILFKMKLTWTRTQSCSQTYLNMRGLLCIIFKRYYLQNKILWHSSLLKGWQLSDICLVLVFR